MTRYAVHMSQDWTYQVEADSPEAAAQTVDDGDAGPGECTGYSIEAVTLTGGHPTDEDLRSPVPCHGKCGTQLPASSYGECTRCLLKRVATGTRSLLALTAAS